MEVQGGGGSTYKNLSLGHNKAGADEERERGREIKRKDRGAQTRVCKCEAKQANNDRRGEGDNCRTGRTRKRQEEHGRRGVIAFCGGVQGVCGLPG